MASLGNQSPYTLPGYGTSQPRGAHTPEAAQRTVRHTLSSGGGHSESSLKHPKLKLSNDNWLVRT